MQVQDFLKHILLSSFHSLPLILLGFLGFMSLGLGNLGMFILFIGHITVLPAVVGLLHMVFNLLGKNNALFTKPVSDMTLLVPSAAGGSIGNVSVMPSWWMSHIVFFMVYILANMASIYQTPSAPGADQWKINNRQARVTSVIIGVVVATVALTVLRYWLTGAETPLGILGVFATIGPLAALWYSFAETSGAKNADIFGVVQQMLSPSARQPPPMTCTYTAPASSAPAPPTP